MPRKHAQYGAAVVFGTVLLISGLTMATTMSSAMGASALPLLETPIRSRLVLSLTLAASVPSLIYSTVPQVKAPC
jgi:hypothetical protein